LDLAETSLPPGGGTIKKELALESRSRRRKRSRQSLVGIHIISFTDQLAIVSRILTPVLAKPSHAWKACLRRIKRGEQGEV